jgi:hypothetical protein
MRHGLNLEQIRKICKKHYLAMLHIEGTIEADMVALVNEIMRLREILKLHKIPTDSYSSKNVRARKKHNEIKGGGKSE